MRSFYTKVTLKQLLFILGYKADIICLQEVDNKVFESDLKPIFSSLGFGAEFSKKGGQVSEGTACIYNGSKFRLIQSSNYILANELLENPSMKDLLDVVQKNENLSKRILERTTACQIIILESLQNGKRVVVANTHLYFHPDADHIRLLQACIGLRLAQSAEKRETVVTSFLLSFLVFNLYTFLSSVLLRTKFLIIFL